MTVIASCIHSMDSSGGSELNAVRTVEQLALRHHKVFVLTFDDSRRGMYERYIRAGAEVAAFPVDSLVGLRAVRQVLRMASFMRANEVEVVITHDVYCNFLMILAARYAGIPSIASKRYTDYTYWQHRYTDRIGFRLATRILANSAAVAGTVKIASDQLYNKIEVIPNFVDDALFSFVAKRDESLLRLGVQSTGTVHGIVAQLRVEKNHLLLLDAFRELAAEREDVHLLIIGDGPERSNIQSHIQKLGLSSRVSLAGHVPSAWQAFAAIDVAFLPSLHEGFPNALIEAMAMGVPVVASNVGGIPDAIDDGRTGLLVPPGDLLALATAMRDITDDIMLRRRLGENARAKALRQYGAAGVIDRLVDLLEGAR